MSWRWLLVLAVTSCILFSVVNTDPEGGDQMLQAGVELLEEGAKFSFSLRNIYDVPSSLLFSSGQQFELVVTDEDGAEVYRFSEGRFFTMALIFEELRPGESLSWIHVWDCKDKLGRPAEPGKYRAEITILAQVRSGEMDAEEFSTVVEFEL
ncbi:MAG: BsuPI-related putative proteinase inhibitor [Limnochordia bacterium]|jgi:hypothetical protein|nr:BsuPI-related putative proteinase inhibitor [Bacillota bacterium]HBG09328.1 hypothetical protein [Bacillota bacterium]